MKQFSCGDVVPGCDRTLQAPDEPTLLTVMHAHAVADHGVAEVPLDIVAAVRRAMVTV